MMNQSIFYLVGCPEHKGVEELIKSVVNLKLKNLRLLMVGGDV